MRATLTRLVLVATAALAAVALPAAAQQSVAPSDVRLAAAHRAAPDAVRPVAVYRFAPTRAAGIPAEVVVADSAGHLVASLRLRSGATYPMMADLSTSGLVLQGETPAGMLTLYLYEPDGGSAHKSAGHWWLEEQEGELTVRTVR